MQTRRVRVGQRLGKAVIQKILEKQQNACYVLITCAEPCDEGKMEVELTYDGDIDLAAYLVESAYGILDGEGDSS